MTAIAELLAPEERRERFADPRPGVIALPLRRAAEAAVEQMAREAEVIGATIEWI